MDKKKVLIIDDDQDMIETTGKLLGSYNFEIYSSITVDEGISKIKDIKPDIILLDVMFPEKKTRGFEAVNEIKKINPKIPIILFTAINREYSFGFNKEDIDVEEFVNKPIEIDVLVNLINKHIG